MQGTTQRRIRHALGWRVAYVPAVLKRLGGTRRAVCNLCGFQGRFRARGLPPRFDAECPNCWCLERHRLLKLWFDEHRDLVAGKEILHFAPEPSLVEFMEPVAKRYVTADLKANGVDRKLNIEHIEESDHSYDVVVCSHILEHVDDRKALAELRRILRPGGIALFMFPIIEGWDETYENPVVWGAAAREQHFGQRDHVRYYGRDVRSRISAAGLELDEYTAYEPFIQRHNLIRGEKLFIGRRAAQAERSQLPRAQRSQVIFLTSVEHRRRA
jgi:SAM-dependent methyltransferase